MMLMVPHGVSTWLPSVSFQSAEPHLMVLEQHFAAKVNLIAAEGPLEEDRMVALHGFALARSSGFGISWTFRCVTDTNETASD